MKKHEKSTLIPLIRNDLRENFTPYSSAAAEMGKIADAAYLNANENPYPFKGLEGLERYDVQQPPALIQAIAGTYQVNPQHVITTRGSDESIDLLIRMFCTAGKDAIVSCPPTFGMYDVYRTMQGAKHIEIPLIEKNYQFTLDTKKIIAAAQDPQKNVKLVFLCCPNSPTGNTFDPRVITQIITELNGHAAVVVDEAYIDFTAQESFVTQLSDHPNLIVLRTLSKAHALAGERVGSTLCADTDFMNFMRGYLAPYPLPKSVTANAISALNQAQEKQIDMTAKIISEREKLACAFEASDLVEHVYTSETNFLMIKFISLETAQNFLQKALKDNIILRDISTKAETENCLRISVGNETENAKLCGIL